MKLISTAVVVALAALVALGAQVPASSAPHNPIYAHAHASAHFIEFDTILQHSKCSATAVGPHALLSATHCELGTNEMELDGYTVEIGAKIRDGMDHTIFILPKMDFADYSIINQTLPEQGDDIFYFGGPDKMTDWFRRGYVVSVMKPDGPFSTPDDPTIIAFDSNGYPGDSGAGIFNTQGEVEGVVTSGIVFHAPDAATRPNPDSLTAKFMNAVAMKFTSEQLEKAAK